MQTLQFKNSRFILYLSYNLLIVRVLNSLQKLTANSLIVYSRIKVLSKSLLHRWREREKYVCSERLPLRTIVYSNNTVL